MKTQEIEGIKIKCEYEKLIDTAHLIENPKNANKHSKEQIERLAKLLEFQGWRHPIIVSKRSGFIVAGHGRLLAAKHLGIKKVPVDYQDFQTEAEEYAFVVSDNEIARWAELDEEKLIEDLKDLDLGDIDLLGLIKIPEIINTDFNLNKELELAGVDGDNISDGVRKAILIDFSLEDYNKAFNLIKQKRENGIYVGGLIIKYLEAENENNRT